MAWTRSAKAQTGRGGLLVGAGRWSVGSVGELAGSAADTDAFDAAVAANLEAAQPLKRVIFLDVDGVLNRQRETDLTAYLPSRMPFFRLRRDCIARLARLVTTSEAVIVLCSTWRKVPALKAELWVALQAAGISSKALVGETPDMTLLLRAREIAAWVERHKPAAWVVLDDMDLRVLGPRAVRVNPREALTDEDCKAALRLLGCA